eukprot:1195828-Prorocentrum_minimum.AAC.3
MRTFAKTRRGVSTSHAASFTHSVGVHSVGVRVAAVSVELPSTTFTSSLLCKERARFHNRSPTCREGGGTVQAFYPCAICCTTRIVQL